MDDVCTHVKEMLEASTFHTCQSLWCNTVILVHKKDRGVHFCIIFHKLNARTKRDSYQLNHIQEVIKSLVGAGYFSCLELKASFWQIAMAEAFLKKNKLPSPWEI